MLERSSGDRGGANFCRERPVQSGRGATGPPSCPGPRSSATTVPNGMGTLCADRQMSANHAVAHLGQPASVLRERTPIRRIQLAGREPRRFPPRTRSAMRHRFLATRRCPALRLPAQDATARSPPELVSSSHQLIRAEVVPTVAPSALEGGPALWPQRWSAAIGGAVRRAHGSLRRMWMVRYMIASGLVSDFVSQTL